ncbi:MAG: T9SS type A sorting domain-containing protein [Bacteroidota bacterium]
MAQIWGVISDKGDSLCLTTTFNSGGKPQLFLRKVSYDNISQQGNVVQLTTNTDFASISNLTDHKHIILNNQIYVAFSTIGDSELYIFKTDINGNRIGNIVTVCTGSSAPTNDMTLVTDGTFIYVKIFMPPNSKVFKYDTGLNPIGTAVSANSLPHNNLGTAVFHNSQFYNFSGSVFGYNSNLVLTKWTNSWAPNMSNTQTLVSAVGGEGNFFSTGVSYDANNGRWYIGMNNIPANQSIGQEHLEILAFDSTFSLLQRKIITGNSHFRSHFVLKGNFLYVSCDGAGAGVYLEKYAIEQTTGIKEEQNIFSASISPNPADQNASLSYSLKNVEQMRISLVDITGKEILIIANEKMNPGNHRLEINSAKLSAGIYICKIQGNSGIQSIKLLVGK